VTEALISMNRTPPKAHPSESPAKQLAGFIAQFDPAIAKLMRSARTALRKRFFPTAVELVYDNYNALAIGWGPNERASEVIVSLGVYARGVSLYFTHGAKLPDPRKLLQGSGNQGRFIRLTSATQLNQHAIASLLHAAIRLGKTPLPTTGRGYTVIKSISAKQRPRRPPAS
jgi:hypothetical protein